MRVGSLFSGIGGIDLGLERAGMRVVWQCESDAYCRGVLARHWPGVPCYPDVRTLMADAASSESGAFSADLPRDDQRGVARATVGRGPRGLGGGGGTRAGGQVPLRVPSVDVLAGGFPCQPVSLAGKGLAQADERWLWPEFARLIRLLRPRYVIAENVPGLLTRGLDIVLADLAALRFDAEWTVFGARDVGAPHRRDRVWIVAWDAAAHAERRELRHEPGRRGRPSRPDPPEPGDDGAQGPLAHANGARLEGPHERPAQQPEPARRGFSWPPEPDVGRVAHGIPNRLDRLRALGNAVVPACAEHIGRIVMQRSGVVA